MELARPRSSDSALGCVGDRWDSTTNAIPVSFGSDDSSEPNASSPPADAPIATIANWSRTESVTGEAPAAFGRSIGVRFFGIRSHSRRK
jgi:hypothetical protein